ncbi:MAG TPA: leukotriene A4 hydrolase C-terminal domain-containing protein, partial [Blastocatellia bacterium]|nr:leukotriene A4 hydrolase C-terminal domain-containing protein [Blastocatellia bacterium]
MRIYATVLCALLLVSIPKPMTAQTRPDEAKDFHSYSNPEQVTVKHADLDWDVLFDQKVLKGSVVLTLERKAKGTYPLILDTRDLTITKAETSVGGKSFQPTTFAVGKADPILGAPLTINLPARATRVRVYYSTSPKASGLQWLSPEQTAGKKHPFMFSQSQAIHARSWIPLQDTPKVRLTYNARVRTPKELLAVMSAANEIGAPRDGDYSFKMAQPISSYLIAIGVGDIAFRPIGKRTGVYAEPTVVERAATEFADTEKMVEATERLYGPYRWERYDLLVLPPSFPFGGMENPRLTFATPTIIAGDKSLVSLIAHELAHSWSGNLVTNATWRDFWLNEGFTVYLERRIQEAVYGRAREEMEAVLGRQDVEREMESLEERDEILHVDLKGRDPDEGFTQVPYEKGALFLRHLEETFGRERFDRFVRGYFDHFAFQSITTADFVAYLKKNLLDKNPELAARVPVEEWIYKPGIPASAPRAVSDAFAKVERQADHWLKGETAVANLDAAGWTTQEWLHFLRHLPADLDKAKMAELDKRFNLTASGNSEIAHQWLLMAIRGGYEPAYARLDEYLISIGRRKLIK